MKSVALPKDFSVYYKRGDLSIFSDANLVDYDSLLLFEKYSEHLLAANGYTLCGWAFAKLKYLNALSSVELGVLALAIDDSKSRKLVKILDNKISLVSIDEVKLICELV